MEVRKEYTVRFSREEINKIAAAVGCLYEWYYDLENIEQSECSPVLQELNGYLGQAKDALGEFYDFITDYAEDLCPSSST